MPNILLRQNYERMIGMKTQKITTKTLVYGAILVALNIVITRLLSINVGVVRIGFNFVPVVLGSVMFGPIIGAVLAVVADVLGMLMSGGLPWLGFCVNQALYGFTYGVFFYKRKENTRALLVCVVFQAILIDAILGALWYKLHAGAPFFASLGARSIDALVMIPVKFVVIKYMLKLVGDRIKI